MPDTPPLCPDGTIAAAIEIDTMSVMQVGQQRHAVYHKNTAIRVSVTYQGTSTAAPKANQLSNRLHTLTPLQVGFSIKVCSLQRLQGYSGQGLSRTKPTVPKVRTVQATQSQQQRHTPQ